MLAAVALGVAAVGLALSALFLARPTVAPAPAPAPVVVLPSGANVASLPAPEPEEKLGGLVHNTQETFDAGIAVKGVAVVGSDRSVSSTNLYVTGVATGNVAAKLTSTMSSSATTTACSFYNGSGVVRTVTSAGVRDRGTASSLGSVIWLAGTSTYPGVATVATGKALNTAVVRLSGVDRITTTSTPQLTAYTEWASGEYFNFVSATTTNAGACSLTYL
jgi:hypothetical protein